MSPEPLRCSCARIAADPTSSFPSSSSLDEFLGKSFLAETLSNIGITDPTFGKFSVKAIDSVVSGSFTFELHDGGERAAAHRTAAMRRRCDGDAMAIARQIPNANKPQLL